MTETKIINGVEYIRCALCDDVWHPKDGPHSKVGVSNRPTRLKVVKAEVEVDRGEGSKRVSEAVEVARADSVPVDEGRPVDEVVEPERKALSEWTEDEMRDEIRRRREMKRPDRKEYKLRHMREKRAVDRLKRTIDDAAKEGE